ncbi:MAG: PLP-dependent aminotransferase family protein [Nocardioidaceae bacterium]
MSPAIGARRVATVVAGFDTSPAWSGLACALRTAIGDGRIPVDVRLPSERELAGAVGVSRTTATRAYVALREQGYAAARQGSGTFTRIPGGRARTLDRALSTRAGDDAAIDLNCAASSAPPGIEAAYLAAVAELPAYLSGHGYYPAGLPELQRLLADGFIARGLPTGPDQVLVTSGALTAAAVAAQALVRPGDRVVVESPGYPNAAQAFEAAGARLVAVPVGEDGWDLDTLESTVRRLRPRAAYLVPDFHNPTGRLMTDAERARVARTLADAGTVAVVDESHHLLALDDQRLPQPLARHVAAAGGSAITVGAASKSLWGGLRMGWARVEAGLVEDYTRARLAVDLGAPVLEQLALVHLLGDAGPTMAFHRSRLREQRDALVAAVSRLLPEWTFTVPDGGLALWCRLPRPLGPAVVVEAEARGVVVAPGPVFAPEGGLASWVRIPFTRPVPELERAVEVLAESWAVTRRPGPGGGRPTRAMVA